MTLKDFIGLNEDKTAENLEFIYKAVSKKRSNYSRNEKAKQILADWIKANMSRLGSGASSHFKNNILGNLFVIWQLYMEAIRERDREEQKRIAKKYRNEIIPSSREKIKKGET